MIKKIFPFLFLFLISIYLQSCTPNIFTVTYIVDGKEIYSISVKKNELITDIPEDPDNENFNLFLGWYLSPGESELFDFKETKITKRIKLYAHFSDNVPFYVIRYFVEPLAEFDYEREFTVPNGTILNKPLDPIYSLYPFLGWFDINNNPIDFTKKIRGNLDIYARFDLSFPIFTVFLDKGIGDFIGETNILILGGEYLDILEPSIAHGEFLYWVDEEGNFFDIARTPITRTILLTAIYLMNEEVRIDFVIDIEDIFYYSKTSYYYAGDKILFIDYPTIENYNFLFWALNGVPVSDIDNEFAVSNSIYYAIYEEILYHVVNIHEFDSENKLLVPDKSSLESIGYVVPFAIDYKFSYFYVIVEVEEEILGIIQKTYESVILLITDLIDRDLDVYIQYDMLTELDELDFPYYDDFIVTDILFEEGIFTWEVALYATSYEVIINGISYFTTENSFNIYDYPELSLETISTVTIVTVRTGYLGNGVTYTF
ncbi:MAG: InlB B-repeat-containing protein [Acholeplasmatales bacterium]|jgi:hypothetical protein|nr:InlB B-repeat-containing protein [Acholeplasmatales bacterium]